MEYISRPWDDAADLDRALSMTAAARLTGMARATLYRKLDPTSPYFDRQLSALVRHHPTGRPYIIKGDLLALLRNRCSGETAGHDAAA